MLDLGHLPTAAPQDVFVFFGNSRILTAATASWTKPRGVTMVQIFCIGQGGGGTAGAVGATAAGGVGGGSGGQSTLLVPASYLPQTLFIGSGAGGSGTAVHSFVSVKPNGATAASQPVASDILLIANGAVGNAVTAAGAATASSCILSGLGIARFLAGTAGGAAGATTPTNGGDSTNASTGLVVTGGGGGGGMSATTATHGGSATTQFSAWVSTPATGYGATGTSGVDGGKGSDGFSLMGENTPRLFLGGFGGGAGFPTVTTSNGGNGGAGGYGCGGGGGGGAVTGKTAGVGGKGGPGLVIITCW